MLFCDLYLVLLFGRVVLTVGYVFGYYACWFQILGFIYREICILGFPPQFSLVVIRCVGTPRRLHNIKSLFRGHSLQGSSIIYYFNVMGSVTQKTSDRSSGLILDKWRQARLTSVNPVNRQYHNIPYCCAAAAPTKLVITRLISFRGHRQRNNKKNTGTRKITKGRRILLPTQANYDKKNHDIAKKKHNNNIQNS